MGRHFNPKAGTVFILNLGCFNPDILFHIGPNFLPPLQCSFLDGRSMSFSVKQLRQPDISSLVIIYHRSSYSFYLHGTVQRANTSGPINVKQRRHVYFQGATWIGSRTSKPAGGGILCLTLYNRFKPTLLFYNISVPCFHTLFHMRMVPFPCVSASLGSLAACSRFGNDFIVPLLTLI